MVRISLLLNILGYLVAALGVAPLYPYLGLPAQLALPAALAVGLAGDRRGRAWLPPLAATLLSLLCVILYGLQVSRANLVPPVVNILALLLAVRLATEKSGRNYLQIFLLALFALASSSLLSLSIAFFIFLVPVVVAITVGLVLLCFFGHDPGLRLERRSARLLLGTSLVLPAGSLLLMLFFFAILPRTQQPLWHFLAPPAQAESGFSDKVEPGSVSSMAALRKAAFRAQSPELPPADLYWRGIVLNRLEGFAWVRQAPPERQQETASGGRPVEQIIYPEPHREKYLPLLDIPRDLQGVRARRDADRVFVAAAPLDRRAEYTGLSLVGGQLAAAVDTDPGFYLQTPTTVSPRLRTVAEGIRREGRDAATRIDLAERFFLGQQLRYSLTSFPQGTDPVDAFLFETKSGYCEFFASSFALLLRLSGVPARLAGGYLGGEYNALAGYYVVTEDTAHVWVEALVDGHWQRLDPSRLAINAGAVFAAGGGGRFSSIGRLLDTIDYYWNRAVISYDLDRQFELARGARGELHRLNLSLNQDWSWLGLLGGALVLGWGGWHLLRWWRTPVEERLLRAFLRAVQRRHGLGEVPASQPLLQLALQLDDPLCRAFVAIYGGAVYRDRRLTAAELAELKHLLRQLREHRPAG